MKKLDTWFCIVEWDLGHLECLENTLIELTPRGITSHPPPQGHRHGAQPPHHRHSSPSSSHSAAAHDDGRPDAKGLPRWVVVANWRLSHDVARVASWDDLRVASTLQDLR
jgi:hypothetical protein